MVILITGASHTGKTLLAQRLLERYQKAGEPVTLIDHDFDQTMEALLLYCS